MQTILIVDDEPLIVQVWKRIFHPMDCALLSAEDGVQALQILREQDIDVLVTDLCMPNLDGVGLLDAIQSDARFSRLSTFVCSGFTKESCLDGFFIERVIAKPFDVKKERAYFRTFLECHR